MSKNKKPVGNGKVLTKREAYDKLIAGGEVMCYEYGSDNCEEIHVNRSCTCWTGMYRDDLKNDDDSYMTFEEFDKMGWENFEVWS